MRKGLSRYPYRRRTLRRNRMRRAKRQTLAAPTVLLLGLVVPFAHSAQATEIYYARAIGSEFLPDASSSQPAAPGRAAQPSKPELPGLGTAPTRTPQPSTTSSKSSSGWSKILIGTLVVGAIAALANRGGGGGSSGDDSGSSNSSSSGDSSAPTTSPPPSSSGSNGGGGINIGIGGGGITIGRNRD